MSIESTVWDDAETGESVAARRSASRPKPRLIRSADAYGRLLSNAAVATVQNRKWKRAYHRRVLAVDTLIIVTAVVAAVVAPAVLGSATLHHASSAIIQTASLAVAFVIAWVVALEVRRSRDISLVGIGAEEYGRVVSATIGVAGVFAILGLLLDFELPRSFLVVALTVGLVGLLLGRHGLRRYLARRRTRGEFITRVVVLGKPESVQVLCESFGRSAAAGYRVVGACVPGFTGAIGEDMITPTGLVPVVGDDHSVVNALQVTKADALAVAAVEHLGYKNTKKLLWQAESLDTELIVVPGFTDIAGPRLKSLPIDNLPLFHVTPTRKEGVSVLAKRILDLAVGGAALFAAMPLMVLAAMAIKFDDGGPVMFRQERVGHRGNPFRIYKFRTMTVDAEARKDTEKSSVGHVGIFYKSACDSRITRVGRFLRATSIDELPQLFNVLGGSMSIVGPRPLVPGEGAAVEDYVERRGLVKPGITGLWQISGRSDLSEEERIRLDHSYVDNWSCVLDLLIVWRTARAVLRRDGAY